MKTITEEYPGSPTAQIKAIYKLHTMEVCLPHYKKFVCISCIEEARIFEFHSLNIVEMYPSLL